MHRGEEESFTCLSLFISYDPHFRFSIRGGESRWVVVEDVVALGKGWEMLLAHNKEKKETDQKVQRI